MTKSKKELADIALDLFKNLDEAEQFSTHISDIFYHLDKKYLLYLISDMANSVEDNLARGDNEILVYSEDDIKELLKNVKKILGD